MDLYVKEFGVTGTHDEFYTDMNIREKFFNYAQFIVSRYAHEPSVIAWELANDARCNSTLSASEFCNTNIVTQWHADTSNFVRSIDPNHLITAGYVRPHFEAARRPSNFDTHQDSRLLLSDMPQVIPATTSTSAFPSSGRDRKAQSSRSYNPLKVTPNGFR
jgi:endo-1,4-beta-mannosidase